jgi:hypothetical protein
MQTAIYLSIPLSIPVHSLFVLFFFSFFLIVFSLVLFLHLSRLPNASTPDRKSNAGPSEISEFLLGLVVGRLFFPSPSTRKPCWQERKETSAHAQEGQQRLLNIQANVPSISQLLPSLFLVFPSSGYSHYMADTEQHLQLDHRVHSGTKQVPRLGAGI